MRSTRMLAAILALAIAPVVYHVCSAPIFDDDERPVFPEYERGLDIALLAGVTMRRDRKTPSPLQGVLPLACRPARDLEELHRSQALTDDPGEGTFLGPQFASGGSDEAAMRTQTLTQSLFLDAALAWLESRKPYISARTYSDYEWYIRVPLNSYFAEMRLTDIDADHLRAYQRMRLARAGASAINKECSVLQQMLKRLGCWAEIASQYQPLPLPKESPHRALTPQEEERLYRIGPTNPKWEVAYCAFVISLNTTAGPGEIRHLRLMDIDHEKKTLRVQPEGAKNEHRIRVIPLNQTAIEAVEYLLARAKRLGASDPAHYLIPFRISTGQYDPTRPAEGWRSALREMLTTAEIKISAYSFRHHAITKLLENPDVSEEVAEAVAGHISHRMKKRYSHVRIEMRRAAVAALERIAPKSVRLPVHDRRKAT